MLFGVLFISMPLAIVGNNFCLVWDDKERVIFVEKLRAQLARRGLGPEAILDTVEAMDADGSGMLSFREFVAALRLLEIKLSSSRLAVLWRTLDTDHSGDVSIPAFVEVVLRDDPANLERLRARFRRDSAEATAPLLHARRPSTAHELARTYLDSPRSGRGDSTVAAAPGAAENLAEALDRVAALRCAQAALGQAQTGASRDLDGLGAIGRGDAPLALRALLPPGSKAGDDARG